MHGVVGRSAKTDTTRPTRHNRTARRDETVPAW